MNKIAATVLGFVFLLACQSPSIAAGPTYVTSHVMASTTWTKADSPYIIQGDILVAKGAILTIEPGVEVRFVSTQGGKVTGATTANTDLIVQGGLRAVGSSTEPIQFVPYTAGTYWGAIYFSNADSTNCLLQGCMIKGGKVVCNFASPTITQCAIFGSQSGIEVAYNAQPQIVNNRITANGAGIVLWANSSNPVLQRNQIYNNNFGIYAKSFGTPTITDNAIYQNRKYNVVNFAPADLTMINNDFRDTVADNIARLIYDGLDRPGLGKVLFMPYVGMPAGTTMAGVTAQPAAKEEPKLDYEEELWGYGRPFDAMKLENLEKKQAKPSSTIKILAVGATAALTVIFLFL